MKKHESMFALAAETATNSPFHMAHGAVLVRSGVVLATANNHLGGNRLSPSCPSTHAEIATLARFFGGAVKQCFEKPSEALFCIDKERQSGSEPPDPGQRVSRRSKQRVQQRRQFTVSTYARKPDSCVKCSKRKGRGGTKERGTHVLWD
jgi:hypothetical protein